MTLLPLVWLAVGCGGAAKPCVGDACEDSGAADSGVATDSGDSGAGGDSGAADSGDSGEVALTGTFPDADVPAPVFEVLAMDDTVRTRDDLMGHPTIVWFYPAAGTAG